MQRMHALLTGVAVCCSCYPLYPPPPGAMLDCSHASLLRLQSAPDILITPSDLGTFARPLPRLNAAAVPQDADSILGINPGRLAKAAGGGTYAHVQIKPWSSSYQQASADGQQLRQAIADRCRVDVKRI